MRLLLQTFLTSTLLLGSAYAQFSVTFTVDEKGHGTGTNTNGIFSPLPSALLSDPGPGGMAAALTYGLLNPPGLVAGDLILLEPAGGGVLSDLIRYNPNQNGGSLVFYSDFGDAADQDLADTGFPRALYTNTLTVDEVGSEAGPNGFTYTPTAGQPGFVRGSDGPVTYVIKSDLNPVPEPSSILMLITVLGILSYRLVLHRRHA